MAARDLCFVKTLFHEDGANYPLVDIGTALEEKGLKFRLRSSGRQLWGRAGVRFGVLRTLVRAGGPLIIPFMGIHDRDVFPYCYWTELVPVLFDCWPHYFKWWESFFSRYRTRLAFFTARQSTEYFANVLKDTTCVWLPEATDPRLYDRGDLLASREIDVLEIGRKHSEFHDKIRPALEEAGYCHVYSAGPHQLVFPNRSALSRGLCTAKISICIPASITHPERSGWVNTTTHRYFESMAARCILLGVCPPELADLFGYNPVIEIDRGHETEQIFAILKNPGAYQNLVDRNYETLLERGTWQSRADDIIRWTGKVCA
jgi:hypothetical protein